MDCRALQDKMIGREDLSPENLRHIDGCDACRRFAADLRLMGGMRDASITTPAPLREHTLNQCREIMAARTGVRRLTFWRRCRRVADSPRFIAAAAALAAITLGWWIATQAPAAAGDDDSILSIKLTVAQLGIQNFGAALFFPVLLWRAARRRAPDQSQEYVS